MPETGIRVSSRTSQSARNVLRRSRATTIRGRQNALRRAGLLVPGTNQLRRNSNIARTLTPGQLRRRAETRRVVEQSRLDRQFREAARRFGPV